MININPIEIIKFAQFSNSLLLPIIAIILLWLINNKKIISDKYNYRYQNILGVFIVIISLLLGVKGLISLF
jgi:Mn2+/Fe2+ NRAMP family transporter